MSQFPLDQQMVISSEVESMLEKQASNNSCATQQGEFYITNICGPQKGWGLSPVINLKVLNLLVVEEHFKVEGFHMVKDLVENKDWMTKIDMKDAHFLVPIHPTHQKLLQFQWMGTTYQFCCLPFGLSYAPYIHQTDETCSGFLETERHQADYIPRRPDIFCNNQEKDDCCKNICRCRWRFSIITYTCRYFSGHLIPIIQSCQDELGIKCPLKYLQV